MCWPTTVRVRGSESPAAVVSRKKAIEECLDREREALLPANCRGLCAELRHEGKAGVGQLGEGASDAFGGLPRHEHEAPVSVEISLASGLADASQGG